jgi:hypothetical protein
MNRFGTITLLIGTVSLTSFVSVSPVIALPSSTSAAININDRAAVIAAYEAEFNRVEPPIEWTGNVGTCNGGTTSVAYQQSILQRTNWLRRMAGVPDVTYNAALNAQQQAGALISAAEGSLSHVPAQTAKCWTQSGFDSTSSSNLYLGVNGANAMNGYVHDPGANNAAAGHRWWLLHTGLNSITSGDIADGMTHYKSNALHVFDYVWNPSQTPRDGFVAWPPPGYVPDDLVYPRWSLVDYGNSAGVKSNFTNATVTVTGPLGPIPVSYEHRAQGSIVFIPTGFESAPLQVTADQTYTVRITGATGGSTSSYTYSVTIVPANSAPFDFGTFGYRTDKCAEKGDFIGGPTVRDAEGDSTTLSLVSGDGDTDNALFVLTRSGSSTIVTAAANLDGLKRNYSVRYRITDSKGAYFENTYKFTLADTASGVCPTSTTTEPTPSYGSSKTVRRTVVGTITRGKSRAVTAYSSRPAGTVRYAVTGGCRLSSTKKTIYARKTRGNCVLTMTGKTSSTTRIITIRLRVR